MPPEVRVRVASEWLSVVLDKPIDLAQRLDGAARDAQFFDASPARSAPMTQGAFIGDTRAGGSCNVRVWTLNPHCNGTHTETVGHLTHDDVAIGELLPSAPMLAQLLSVNADTQGEIPSNTVVDHVSHDVTALVLRTHDGDTKQTPQTYPVLAAAAMRSIAAAPIQHLLIDTPSLDRADDRTLLNHRVFWGLPSTGRDASVATHPTRTITESIAIPRAAPDGVYLLCFGAANWASDAAPSRPTLYSLERTDHDSITT